MPRATRLQFYYVTVDSKVDEKHIKTKFSKCNSLQDTTNLLNSQKFKVAIVQLCYELHVCNFTMF